MPFKPSFIVLTVWLCLGFESGDQLKVAKEGLKKIDLVLKDELSGSAKESYTLDASKNEGFLKDLNASVEAPTMKMNIACYRFEIHYIDGRVVQLPTNGKGIGPTKLGYFKSEVNLIFKYWPISREQFCKPTQSDDDGGGGTFDF